MEPSGSGLGKIRCIVEHGCAWRLVHQVGLTSTLADRTADLALALGLGVLIWATNRFVAPELGGGLATAVMLLIVEGPRRLRDPAAARRLLARLWPYVLLVCWLMATRLLPPLSDWTRRWLVLDPFGGLAPLALLRHPASWLVLVAVILLGRLPRGMAGALAGGALRAALILMAATLVFVELAGFMAASGGTALFGQAWREAAGHSAALAAPLFGAVAGALTGSSTASNALMMNIQLSLAVESGLPPMLMAAVQTVSGSVCTMLTPGRIVLAASLVGLSRFLWIGPQARPGETCGLYGFAGFPSPPIRGRSSENLLRGGRGPDLPAGAAHRSGWQRSWPWSPSSRRWPASAPDAGVYRWGGQSAPCRSGFTPFRW